jgi:hypothetical protein
MSDAYSDRPPRRDSEGDYTDRPARRDRPDDDEPPRKPKLGSLAQAARGKKLGEARGILLFIGILTIIANGVLLALARDQIKKEIDKEVLKAGGPANVDPAQVKQAEDQAFALVALVNGVAIGLGVLFVVFGIIVKRFPVPITIISLVLYIGAGLGFAALNPASLAQGLIIKIIIVVALIRSIQAALAYEREEREARLRPGNDAY